MRFTGPLDAYKRIMAGAVGVTLHCDNFKADPPIFYITSDNVATPGSLEYKSGLDPTQEQIERLKRLGYEPLKQE